MYNVLVAPTIALLEAAVNNAIKDGWKPVGGVSISASGKSYMQAIVKY